MFKWFSALLLWLALAAPAAAQNPTCATRPISDSSNACASTAFVNGFVANAVSGLQPLLPNFTSNLPLIGNGTNVPTQGTRSGNTTAFVTADAAPVNNQCAIWDASGGLTSATCATGSGTVSSGLQGQTATYAANGTTVGGVLQCIPFETFGGSTGNTGAANDTALNNILASYSGNMGCISFGAGLYNFASSHTYTFNTGLHSLTLRGLGRDATTLSWPSGVNGFIINYPDCVNNSFNLREMTIATAGAATSVGVDLVCTQTTVFDAVLSGQNTILDVSFGAPSGNTAQSGWLNAVKVEGLNNVNFINDNFIGYTPGLVLANGQGVGVNLTSANVSKPCSGSTPCGGAVYNFFGCNFMYGQVGIQYGAYTQGVSVVASNFVAPLFGILVPSSTAGTLDQLSVVNSEFNPTNIGIDLGTIVTDINITGNLFINALQTTSSGFSGSIAYGTFTGNNFWAGAPASHIGALIPAGAHDVVFTGNTFENLNLGVSIDTTVHANVQSNMYSGNSTNTSPASSSGSVTIGGGSP